MIEKEIKWKLEWKVESYHTVFNHESIFCKILHFKNNDDNTYEVILFRRQTTAEKCFVMIDSSSSSVKMGLNVCTSVSVRRAAASWPDVAGLP